MASALSPATRAASSSSIPSATPSRRPRSTATSASISAQNSPSTKILALPRRSRTRVISGMVNSQKALKDPLGRLLERPLGRRRTFGSLFSLGGISRPVQAELLVDVVEDALSHLGILLQELLGVLAA